MDFSQLEDIDGCRWSWLVWPWSRLDATRCVVPFGCMYTPLRQLPQMPPLLPYEPVTCRGASCQAVLNPYCRIDVRSKIWVCPFCMQRNALPAHYADISETNLPAELIPNFTTVEYALPRQPAPPPVFLFVLDTCLREDELAVAKEYIVKSLALLPPEAYVGLITFGQNVHVHVLADAECSRAYVLKGEKEYTTQRISELLSLGFAGGRGVATSTGMSAGGAPNKPTETSTAYGAARFLQPLSESEFILTSLLENTKPDPWPVPAQERARRATCTALSIAVGLLENSHANFGARIELLVGGPCTVEPGKVAGLKLDDILRSHNDIEKEQAPYVKKALAAYEAIAARAVNAGHTIDIWACALDQVGLYEMKSCVDRTAGMFVLAESFNHPMFKRSFEMFFARDENDHLMLHSQASLDVLTSREMKVAGCIGPVASLNKASQYVSQELEIGIGGTSAWRLCSIDPATTLGVYFEIVNNHNTPMPEGQYRYVQFITKYQHSSGQYRERVSTLAGRWADGSSLADIGSGFDQEAAAVLMARMAVYKTENEEAFDILRWLDRMLIRLCARFADYQKDEPESFNLSANFSLYPQFMFNLRRSQFLQVFNSSPDETAYYRSYLNRENTLNGLLMIQPTVMSYTLGAPPVPVLLDITSVKKDAILILDTFFFIIVFCGSTIAQWRKAGYHNDPNHENFRNLLQAPQDDAAAVLDERFPYARYIEADEGGSQARFLLAKLNPSVNHHSANGGYGAGESFVFTDDVSLGVFMEHLKKLAVASQ
ncbi:Protein transport protein SEC23 [Porphyridium purpureum]|uniref:Protein transport protein SEC23 n=1 Tax=Porphyridium purpureum TaxID=35688 RepID=A0A5J4Z3F3_PORPP|nr:Protein transport protein SEC23 [Porphyridium purpureum]|eukprot:POR5600..scf295_1